MPTFKIEHREEIVQVEVYEVEAENEEQALDKYCSELAGSLECINSYNRGPLKEGEEEIEVVQ